MVHKSGGPGCSTKLQQVPGHRPLLCMLTAVPSGPIITDSCACADLLVNSTRLLPH